MSCFNGISKLNRCEILALTNAVSMLLADGLDDDDLNMLGNLLSAIGGIIATFGAIAETSEPKETASA
jgi:hypothetical protein